MATRLPAARSLIALVAAAVIVTACSSPTSSASPSPVPTARPTPNPHLPSPATAQQVFAGLGKAGLRITANTASLGPEEGGIVRKVYATYVGWPLDVTEYRSEGEMTKALPWADGEAPGRGEPLLALAGGNILITWGPPVTSKPRQLNERQVAALTDLVTATDALLAPVKTRTSVPGALPGGPAEGEVASPAAG
jgi:hypothetical protein